MIRLVIRSSRFDDVRDLLAEAVIADAPEGETDVRISRRADDTFTPGVIALAFMPARLKVYTEARVTELQAKPVRR